MILRSIALSLIALALPGVVLAVELRGVEISQQPSYIDVALRFDSKPSYTESYRFDPDRYVLSFSNCKLAVPKVQADALAKLPGKLLTRVSLSDSGGSAAVGFYLNVPVQPLIRYDQNAYYVRFYTGAQRSFECALASGVTLTEKVVAQSSGGNLRMHLLRLEPGCRAKLYSVSADRYDGKTRVRTPSSFARKENADVVINGGFFGGQGQHLSTLVEDGIMRASGVYPTRPMLVITQQGEALIGRYNVVTALRFNGQSLKVSAKNYPFESGKTIVYDHTYPLDSLPQQAMYYYTITSGAMKFHGSDTRGLTLSLGQLLLANDIMPEANPLRLIPDGAAVELETRITDAGGNPLPARSAIGGAPMLVEGGQVRISNEQDFVRDDISRSERSRTAVGITADGGLLLAVVSEVESAGFGGVTLEGLAKLLIAEGAVSAMNLDGGGSSAMVVAGDSLNIAESGQRPVSNVLAVKLL